MADAPVPGAERAGTDPIARNATLDLGKGEPTLIQRMLADRRTRSMEQQQEAGGIPTALPSPPGWGGATSPDSPSAKSRVEAGAEAGDQKDDKKAPETLIQQMLDQRRPSPTPPPPPEIPAPAQGPPAQSVSRTLQPAESEREAPESPEADQIEAGARAMANSDASATSESSDECSDEAPTQAPGPVPQGERSPWDLVRSLIWHTDKNMTPYHPHHEPAGVPDDEEQRLAVLYQHGLHQMGLLDSSELVNLAEAARRLCGTSSAGISILDRDQECFLAHAGAWTFPEVDRDVSFAAHAILTSAPLVVLDASTDERFKYNKLVYGKPNIRLFIGVPLNVMRMGRVFRMGCLCVTDESPREKVDEEDVLLLQTLAEAVVRYVELRPREAELDLTFETQIMVVRCFLANASVSLSEGNILKLAQGLRSRSVPSKQYLTRKGDPGNVMYLIAKGSAGCFVKKTEIERLTKGMCFGEVAIMNMCKMRAAGISEEAIARRCLRMADVRALEHCELYSLSFADAWPLIREIPQLWTAFEEIAHHRSIRASFPLLTTPKRPELIRGLSKLNFFVQKKQDRQNAGNTTPEPTHAASPAGAKPDPTSPNRFAFRMAVKRSSVTSTGLSASEPHRQDDSLEGALEGVPPGVWSSDGNLYSPSPESLLPTPDPEA